MAHLSQVSPPVSAQVEPNPEARARWRNVVQARTAEVLHRLDLLEDAFANRHRYRGGVLDKDGPELVGLIQTRLNEVLEAFERDQCKPRVQLSD